MGFLQPAFIRKNTPELRKELENLGYSLLFSVRYACTNIIYACDGFAFGNIPEMNTENRAIDCGTNESLFLAIAALRDDTDKNQFFVLDANMGSFNAPSSIIPKGSLVKYLTDKWNLPKSDIDSTGIPAHKASVNELIEYFKGKEES